MGKKRTPKDSGRINKSQAIRDALAKNPEVSPKQLSAELNANGINASPAFVSMIKFNMNAKKKTGKKNRNNQAQELLTAENLVEAKKLVDRVGGVEKAQSLLGTLKKLL